MRQLSSKIAEQVYSILIAFANANANYLRREEFIYHFSVSPNTTNDFKLTCTDEQPRFFYCTSVHDMKLSGLGQDRVNPILQKIAESNGVRFIDDFKILRT